MVVVNLIHFLVGKLKSVDYWKVFFSLCAIVVISFVLIFLKFAIRRKRYSEIIPTFRMKFLDPLGNLSVVPLREKARNGFPFHVIIFQCGSAAAQLFRKQTLYFLWASFVPYVVLVKAEAVEIFLGNTKHLDKNWSYAMFEPWLGKGLLTNNGGKWKARRRLVTPSFHFEILHTFLPIFNRQARILVKTLRKEIDKDFTSVLPFIARCSLDIICETTLGIKLGAQANSELKYFEYAESVSRIVFQRMCEPWLWPDFLFYFTKKRKEFNDGLKYLHNFHRSIIQEKLKNLLNGKSDDETHKRKAFLDLLLDIYVQDKSITLEEIREEVDTITFGGHDSVSVSLSWSLFLIGLHKDVQKKIQEELYEIFGDDTSRTATLDDLKSMNYLECALKESRRLYPPVPFFGRMIKQDTEICGYTIPGGASCGVLLYELHRDPDVFPDPEKYDPDRFLPENSVDRHPYAYIPFSAGPRNCIGQRQAVMEEKVIMSTILRNFTIESLDHRDKVIPVPEITLRPSGPIRIRLRPRYDSNLNTIDPCIKQVKSV